MFYSESVATYLDGYSDVPKALVAAGAAAGVGVFLAAAAALVCVVARTKRRGQEETR